MYVVIYIRQYIIFRLWKMTISSLGLYLTVLIQSIEYKKLGFSKQHYDKGVRNKVRVCVCVCILIMKVLYDIFTSFLFFGFFWNDLVRVRGKHFTPHCPNRTRQLVIRANGWWVFSTKPVASVCQQCWRSFQQLPASIYYSLVNNPRLGTQ